MSKSILVVYFYGILNIIYNYFCGDECLYQDAENGYIGSKLVQGFLLRLIISVIRNIYIKVKGTGVKDDAIQKMTKIILTEENI